MNRIFVAVGLIGVAGLVGCDARTPSGPSSVSQPTTPAAENNQLVMFADPYSSFSTSDLYDADEQVVRITVGGNLQNATPETIAPFPQAFPPLRVTRGLSGVASSL